MAEAHDHRNSDSLSTFVRRLESPWAQALLLLVGAVGGAAAVWSEYRFGSAWRSTVENGWRPILIILAGISIGFGVAVLLYQRINRRSAEQLSSDHKKLALRADLLLKASSAQLSDREAGSAPKG
ncbi:MAG TPA: hypothetical protein VFA81_13010 [Burkholderiales bacterium]|nr:hypothetical protein [Burkholderiales bacterium]